MVHLGILAGVRAEADTLIKHLSPDIKVTVYLSGARADKARHFAQQLVADGATHLLSYGFAGGLDPAFPSGTLLLPRAVVAAGGLNHMVDGEWHERATALLRDLAPLAASHLGSDALIATVPDKSVMFRRFRGAVAVDMESHFIAAEAAKADLPYIVLRVICDPATDTIPPAAASAVKANGATSLTKLGLSIVRNPAQLGALNRLARSVQAAERKLLSCCSRGGATGFGVT